MYAERSNGYPGTDATVPHAYPTNVLKACAGPSGLQPRSFSRSQKHSSSPTSSTQKNRHGLRKLENRHPSHRGWVVCEAHSLEMINMTLADQTFHHRHKPVSYDKLVNAVQTAGHEVHCPEHPSMNEARPPTASLAEDSASMRSYAQKLVDAGKRVVAVMHSYRGQVGTNSLYGMGLKTRSEQGLSGGVSELVYVTSFVLPDCGSSTFSAHPVVNAHG